MPYRFIILLTGLFLYPILTVGQERSDRWSEKPAGFYTNTTFGIVTGRGNLFTGMQSSAGYKLNPHIAFGGGIGIERYTDIPTYDTLTANLSLLPLFGEIRYTVLNRRVSPVIALSGGYKVLLNVPSSQMITWTQEIYPGYFWNDYYVYDTYTQGGLFFNVEAGVKANVWKRFNLYLSVDYSFWSVAGDHHYWVYQYAAGVTTETHQVTRTVAYTDQFVVRLGFGF
jgi:hypothetical protein